MRAIENGYRSLRHPYPKMNCVDYSTLDLELVEFNGDQRRLDRAEGMRHVKGSGSCWCVRSMGGLLEDQLRTLLCVVGDKLYHLVLFISDTGKNSHENSSL